MTYEEKFDIVVKAIKEAKKFTPSGYNTKLKISYENRLQELDLDDISSILYQLQNDHKVIKMISTANAKFITGLDPWSEEQDYYALDALDSFDKWSKKYFGQNYKDQNSKNSSSIRSNRKALEKKWDVLQAIWDVYESHSRPDSVLVPVDRLTIKGRKVEIIDGIVDGLTAREGLFQNWDRHDRWYNFELINHKKLPEVYKKIEKAYKKSTSAYQQTKLAEETVAKNPVYKVSYSEQSREILINNFLIKKLRSFSENDAIFAYLYKNPNQDKADDDIKVGTGLSSIKDLNKFIENIGFKGELRRVFFKVSKNKIRFNNPITKEYLEELGIEHFKLE